MPRGRSKASVKVPIDIPAVDKSRASSTSSRLTIASGQDDEYAMQGEFDADENEASIAAARAGKSGGGTAVTKDNKDRVCQLALQACAWTHRLSGHQN